MIKNDELTKFEREWKKKAEKTILNAANLIAPVIEENLAQGFAWFILRLMSTILFSMQLCLIFFFQVRKGDKIFVVQLVSCQFRNQQSDGSPS